MRRGAESGARERQREEGNLQCRSCERERET